MAFYGRVTNESKTSMTFDRIYPNKITMDANVNRINSDNTKGDGVFTGRFVLVDYDDYSGYTGTAYSGLIENWIREKMSDKDAQELEQILEKYRTYCNEIDAALDAENYSAIYKWNYQIDQLLYPNLGRGYDSTVWRKVVTNGEAKYVLLAELNSVVPTFDVVSDHPTSEPVAAHFGADKNNVYYPLHVQNTWGFRIGRDDIHSDFSVAADDYSAFDYTNNILIGKTVEGFSEGYPGAIYFNKDGFNKEISYHSGIAINDNEITLKPVSSGQKYYAHDSANPSATKEYKDTQELRVILPALGDAVSDLYDKIATPDTKNRRSFNTKWEDPNSISDQMRNSSLRLVKGEAGSEFGYDYTPKETESLVGTINAVHDALGMIITEDKRPEEAKDAYSNQIYYDAKDGKFYCTVPTLGYQTIDFEDGDFSLTPKDFANKYHDKNDEFPHEALDENDDEFPALKKYNDEKYFIKTNDTPTYVQTKKAIAGEKYYAIPKHLKFAGNMIAPGMPGGDYQYSSEDGSYQYNGDVGGPFHVYEQRQVLSGEQYIPSQDYFIYNDIYSRFDKILVNENNFSEKVSNGLYVAGEELKYIIDRYGNTLYEIKYVTASGVIGTIKVSTLNRTKDGQQQTYVQNLKTKEEFVNFLQEAISQSNIINPTDTVDYTTLYIASGMKRDEDNPEKYIIEYSPIPINQIMFGLLDVNGYYQGVYCKRVNNGHPNYYRINANFTANENEATYNVENNLKPFTYLVPKQLKEYKDGVYWYVDAPPEKMAELERKRESIIDPLNIINTEEYQISKLALSVNGFTPGIYWSFLDENDTDYVAGQEGVKLVGYAIDDKRNSLDHGKDDNGNNIIVYYTPNILYHKDKNDRYILADDTYNNFNSITNIANETLYRIHELFVVDPGTSSLKRYSRWDNNLIQSTADISTYFKDAENGGYGIKIGWKENDAEWKELEGFAKDLNTIHGWIIRLNRLLNTDDIKTRDTNTLQGCINTLNDLIAKFDELPPGEVLGINKFGNIEAIELLGDKWIDVTKTFTSTGSPKLTISYQGEVSQTANKNVVTNVALDNNTGKINITRKNLSEITLGTAIGNNAPGIETTDTLGQALTKITNHYDNGATNIILSEYNNYSTMPYVITEDTSPQSGKTYYIKNGDAFIEYTSNPWENGITVYEKIENAIIDNNDNINEAIAKLQYQINDHKENQLHISGSGNVIGNLTVENGEITATKRNIGALAITGFTADNTATADLAAADTLNAALNKLQAKIKALTTTVDGNDNADNVQNFEAIGAGDYITSLTLGTDKKLSATTANLNSAINSNVLTNYTEADIGGSNIATSDTLLTALAKLQIQINNITGGAAGATWTAAAPTGTIKSVTAANVVDGDTVATAVNKLQAQIANGWNLAAPNGTITTVSGTVANGDTIATAINKLQTQISSTLTSTQIDDTYAKIFRQETAPTGTLKSGWIWIQTSTKYIYFYTGQAWELLNSWQ